MMVSLSLSLSILSPVTFESDYMVLSCELLLYFLLLLLILGVDSKRLQGIMILRCTFFVLVPLLFSGFIL